MDMTNFFYSSLLVIFFGLLLFGCKSKEIIVATKPEKDTEGEINTANQDGNALDYDQAVAKHHAMQSQRTKNMIARAEKSNRRTNRNKNRALNDRLFNNNCYPSSCMLKNGHTYRTVTKSRSCFIKK